VVAKYFSNFSIISELFGRDV